MNKTFSTYEGHKRELLKRFDFTSIHQAILIKILVDFDNDNDIYEYLLYLNNSIKNDLEQQKKKNERKSKVIQSEYDNFSKF
jgi:hypothetical protein